MDLEGDVGPSHPSVDEIERLVSLFNAVLSSEGETKEAAEQAMKNLEVADKYPVQLTEILLNPNWQTEVRMFAFQKLRQFVSAHWCAGDRFFVPPEIISVTKARIKELLLTGLSETTMKVQDAVGNIMSLIVSWDWPDNWPELFDTLITYLNGENEFCVKGALSFLGKFFLLKLNSKSMDTIARLFREMNRIFAGENYSEEIRCLTCRAFSNLVVRTAEEKEPDMIRRYWQPAVISFCETSMQLWISKNCSSKLKIDILDALTAWMRCIPKYILDFLTDMVPLARELLIDCAKDYQAHVVNGGNGQDRENESIATRMGDYSDRLVEAIINFLERLMDPEHSLSFPDRNLSDDEWIYLQDYFLTPHALGHVIMLMEVTDETIKLWETDFDNFVEEDGEEADHDYPSGRIRGGAKELIQQIRFRDRGIASILFVVIMKYLQGNGKRNDARFSVSQNSWKSHEAFLLAFSLMKGCITSNKDGILARYDVVPILENIVLPDLSDSASHTLLVCRCLTIGGIYSGQMPEKLASAFLEATVNCLRENQPTLVKISAVKAVGLWYLQNECEERNNTSMLLPHVPALFEGLLMLAESVESERVCELCIRGTGCLMPFDKTLTATLASRIYSLTETALLKYSFVTRTEEWLTVFEEFMVNHDCWTFLRERVTADLPRMMIIGPLENCRTGSAALQIMTVLVKRSPLPLSSFLTDTLFFAACDYIIGTNKWPHIQCHGMKLIKTYISVASEEVLSYQDKNERYGAQYILQVVLHDLSHKTYTTRPGEACKILTLLIKKSWNEIRQNIDEMLNTLLHCIRDEETAHTTWKLLMVYAHLISRQSDTIFKFFSNALSPSEQKSSLELIISEGMCKQYPSVIGKERETVKLALRKVLEHAVTNPSSPLHRITLEESSGGSIPLLVKICRLVADD